MLPVPPEYAKIILTMIMIARLIHTHFIADLVRLSKRKLIESRFYACKDNGKILPYMARFGKKKNLTEYLYTKPAVFVLLLVTVFLSTAVYQRFLIERKTASLQAEMEIQRQELLERKALLEEKVEYLSGDRGIEEEIRKHFDVAKEGEQVVILVGNEQPAAAAIAPVIEEEPWYIFWR